MPKFNDFDLTGENWKNIELNMDSLWIINERDKSGKHSNFYHGNFSLKFLITLYKDIQKSEAGFEIFSCEAEQQLLNAKNLEEI